jgi:S1-C subfamily serine protease
MLWRRWVILLLFAVSLAGCAELATHEEKEDSFTPYVFRRVGPLSLRDFIEQRTALLVAGAKPTKVEVGTDDVGVGLKPTDPDGKVDVASAAAISLDGYFLTAAHCIRRQPVFLVIPDPSGPRALPARVVWQPRASAPAEYDLAILKVDALLPVAFTVASDTDVGTGDPVVSSGANGESGGKLIRFQINDASSALGYPLTITLFHDLPLTHGDSGGPLVTLDGRLIGVEILVRGVYFGPREGVALRPDTTWMMKIVDEDRAKRL